VSIADLDNTQRCTLCQHFYHRPNGGKARQLPLMHVPGVGDVCERCRLEVLAARWPDDKVRAVDGVAAELGYVA